MTSKRRKDDGGGRFKEISNKRRGRRGMHDRHKQYMKQIASISHTRQVTSTVESLEIQHQG